MKFESLFSWCKSKNKKPELIPLNYLRTLKCETLSSLFSSLPEEYQNDPILHLKALRCESHWPTEGDVPDCPTPFKINCLQCIAEKIRELGS